MQIRVLGCSGGVGGQRRTTSLLIDNDVLIDAGTGAADLSLAEMRQIRHICITHSHLDHLVTLPLLVDTLFGELEEPLQVYALPETIDAIKRHIFNWHIWPDFSELPNPQNPVVRFIPLVAGSFIYLSNDRKIESVAVAHAVPAVGYIVSQRQRVFAFSGDTSKNDSLWQALNRYPTLDLLIVECAFSNEDAAVAQLAQHYCPDWLAQDLQKLQHQPLIALTHMKPGDEAVIIKQCSALLAHRQIIALVGNEQYQFD
ncbi:MAG: 3',5'-cyclic-nucleotide phosphodiesterase [Gammaproteobacteria bacterium]|nr:3',5'-cyclic-nucleotide phosphodiesterase [Gammaproteobacteria bacterium]